MNTITKKQIVNIIFKTVSADFFFEIHHFGQNHEMGIEHIYVPKLRKWDRYPSQKTEKLCHSLVNLKNLHNGFEVIFDFSSRS